MRIKAFFGAAILTATFASIFAWLTHDSSLLEAAISLALGFGLAGIIAIGINLMTEGRK